MSDNNEDVVRRISESAQPIKLMTKVKRGTATRDQDTIKVSISGDDPAETVTDLNETLELLEETAQTARDIQPEKPK